MLIRTKLLLLLILGPTTALAQQPERSGEVGAGKDIRARIEIQRSTYSLGDTACVRITLTNTVDRRVGYMVMGTADMIHLAIKRSGQLVHPNVEPAGSATMSASNFEPRASWPLANGIWVPITFWGYKLEEAGEYTIEGIPQIWSAYRGQAADTTTVRSNQAAFTLSQDSINHASCAQKGEEGLRAHKPTPAEMKNRSDSLRTATMAKVRAMVDTVDSRHDTTVK